MPGRSSKTRTPEAVAAHSKRLDDLRAANQKAHQKRKGTDQGRLVDQAMGEKMDGAPRSDADGGPVKRKAAL